MRDRTALLPPPLCRLLGRVVSLLAVAVAGPSGLVLAQPADLLAPYRAEATEKWEEAITEFEELDRSNQDPPNAVLFTGSSSIRLWETLADDLAPRNTIRRGYGGARFSDLAVFIERIVQPHKVEALVIFVANDISGSDRDKSPEDVLQLYKYVIGKVRQTHPTQPIFFIAITPTSSRFEVWPQIQRVNQLIREYSAYEDGLHFIATEDRFLGADGKPIDSLFRDDLLHLNAGGHKLWAEIIERALDDVLGPPK